MLTFMHKRINENINVAAGTAVCLSLCVCSQHLTDSISTWWASRSPHPLWTPSSPHHQNRAHQCVPLLPTRVPRGLLAIQSLSWPLRYPLSNCWKKKRWFSVKQVAVTVDAHRSLSHNKHTVLGCRLNKR